MRRGPLRDCVPDLRSKGPRPRGRARTSALATCNREARVALATCNRDARARR
jgi:hypothetical protein